MQTEAIVNMLFIENEVTAHGLQAQNSIRFKLDANMSFSLTIRCVFKLYSVRENFAGSSLWLRLWVQVIQIYMFLLFLIFILIALINLFIICYIYPMLAISQLYLRYLIFFRFPLSYSHTNRLSLLSTDKPQGSLRSQLSM